jgi:hypothetical protein
VLTSVHTIVVRLPGNTQSEKPDGNPGKGHSMAHHVMVLKVPYRTQDGRVLKGKYEYALRCKQCGPLKAAGKITGRGAADMGVTNHHLDVHQRHHTKHPNDLAHLRTDACKRKKAEKTRG